MIFAAVILSQFKEWTSGTIDRDHLVEGADLRPKLPNYYTCNLQSPTPMPKKSTLEELDLSFHPLTQKLWRDFEMLFGENGACGGCWCMY